MSNTFGNILRFSSWGESHGATIGGVIDGFPSKVSIDVDEIKKDLFRRKTGIYNHSSQRCENDEIEFLSGIYNGVTLGTPIAFIIRNSDANSSDYNDLQSIYRPSHADYTYQIKYGIRDHRGGGRASARETVSRVVAGSMAKQWLKQLGINIAAYTHQIACVEMPYLSKSIDDINRNIGKMGALGEDVNNLMFDFVNQVKIEKDGVGGVVRCLIEGVPVGLGEPIFDKLQASLAYAMLSIPSCKGFEYGSGFSYVDKCSSELNDEFYCEDGVFKTKTNHSGGIQGGISNGEQIFFKVAFKPIASILKEQKTVNQRGESVIHTIKGRHDVCIFPRVLPIVESMAALVIMDKYMQYKVYNQ